MPRNPYLLFAFSLGLCSCEPAVTPPQFPHLRASFDGQLRLREPGGRLLLDAEVGFHRARGRLQLVFREAAGARTLLRVGDEPGQAYLEGRARPLHPEERSQLDLVASCFDPARVRDPKRVAQGFSLALGARSLRLELVPAAAAHGRSHGH